MHSFVEMIGKQDKALNIVGNGWLSEFAIPSQTPALLSILGLDNETWLSLTNDFGKDYHGAVGWLEELALFAEHTGKQSIAGKNKLRRIYH
ncbi:MAG: hypothetical protein ACI9LM_005666 [Alteromonadaceae bacterium]|jgi:hypothetical protein